MGFEIVSIKPRKVGCVYTSSGKAPVDITIANVPKRANDIHRYLVQPVSADQSGTANWNSIELRAIEPRRIHLVCINWSYGRVTVTVHSIRTAIATLDDMVRVIGDHDTGEAGHAAWCLPAESIKCTGLHPWSETR